MTKEHKPLPVLGYTTQPTLNVELVNEGKELEERVLRYFDKLESLNGTRVVGDTSPSRIDARCLALGRTNVQTGFMWAFRSVFQPKRATLPEDMSEG